VKYIANKCSLYMFVHVLFMYCVSFRYDYECKPTADRELQQTGACNVRLCVHEITQYEDGAV